MKFVVRKSVLNDLGNILDAETIEKARKGEQAANHKYIFRKPTGKTERPYEYIFIEDLIKRPMKMIKDFFGINDKQIEQVYEKLDIKKDYGATLTDLQQHLLEYFCHRDIWDKRFADKNIRDKNKKPVIMVNSKKIIDKTTETPKPVPMQQSLFDDLEENEAETWKANPTLMRKIWGIYTGSEIVRQENNEKKVIEKVENAKIEPEKQENGNIKKDFKDLENLLINNNSLVITSKEVGNVVLESGEIGKHGFGLRHIIEQRFVKDKLSENEITALCHLIIDTVRNGEITRNNDRNIELSKNGIVAILRKEPNDKNCQWVLTGFANTENEDVKKEAADAISTVIANNNYAPEFSSFRKQVGAVIASINNNTSKQENVNKKEISKEDRDAIIRQIRDFKNFGYSKEKIKNAFETDPMLKNTSYFADNMDVVYAEIDNAFKDEQKETEQEKHDNRSKAMEGNQNAKKFNMSDDEYKKFLFLIKQNIMNYYDIQNGKFVSKIDIRDPRAGFFGISNTIVLKTGDEVEKENVVENLKTKLTMFGTETLRKYTKKGGFRSMTKFIEAFIDNFVENNPNYNPNNDEEFKNELKRIGAYDVYFNIDNNKGDKNNGENQNNLESTGISGGSENLRNTSGPNSYENVSGSENGSNGTELQGDTLQSGIGSEITEGINYDYFRQFGDGSGRLTDTQALKIREACRKILETKTDEQMTEADKAVLSLYVGAGGNKKEKNKSDKAILSEFYTPRKIVNKIWQLVDKYIPQQDKTCIEPSSGIGRFAEGRKEKFTMFEYEPVSARIAKILHPEAEVVQGEFEKNWILDGRFNQKNIAQFDCCVGNPPYMNHSGIYAGRGVGKEFTRAEGFFISSSLKTLKENGVLAMVVPSGMLNSNGKNGTYGADMLEIAKQCELLEAWRLPQDSFDSTAIGTDIIVLRKKTGGSNPEDFINGNYFKKNPTHVCGDIVKEKNQWGDLVDVVRPHNGDTTDSAIDLVNINDIEAIIKELPKAETNIVDNAERNKKISDALKGNKNAAGKHHFVESTGRNLSATEFNQKYGKQFDPKDIEIWKNTDWNGNIDITKLSDDQKSYIEKSDHFIKEGDNYINVVNYASGNLKNKLNDLEAKKEAGIITENDYEFRKLLLNAALPAQKELGQFNLSPIADWTIKYKTKDGHSLINGFMDWAFNGRINKENELPIDSPIAPEEIPPDCTFGDIVAYINKIPLRVSVKDGENKTDRKRVQFRRAEGRRDTAEKLFNRFLQEGLSVDDQKDLTDNWNTNFNAFVNPDYTKIPVFIDGMNEKMGNMDFTLTPQQIKGITFLTNKGAGLLAYDVGVGKTVTGICATVNQIQTGRAKRPLICVPNAVYENWYAEIKQHFPDMKINELKNLGNGYMPGKDWKPEEGTITLCTYEALEKMTFHDETLKEIHEDVEFAQLQTNEKPKSDRKRAQENEKIDELVGSMTKTGNDYAFFDDMGFDHITVDEIHNFKNIFTTPSKLDGIETEEGKKAESNEFRGLSGSKSDRGEKLFAITQYIQRHNNNRNVFGLSATPFQNSPIEIYNILSLFARQRLKELGIYSLQEFVKQFALLKSEYVVTATEIKEKMVMKSFNNLGALQNLITEYIDKVDGGEAHVIRPRKRTHLPRLEMTDVQRQIMQAEAAYIEQQSKLPKAERDPGSTLNSLNAMRMATLAPGLVSDERYAMYASMGFNIKKPSDKEFVESSPKLKFVCESVIQAYKNNNQHGQVIYMPRGVTKFPLVTEYLVKHGVPKDAIIEMAGGDSGSEKKSVEREDKIHEFNDVNGKAKIIIGSENIKEGVNLNGNSTVLYNTMLGWNPTETTQVEGRIWRQGNKQGITHIVYPLLNDSIDPMMYQKYDEKKSRIDNLFSFKGDQMNVEEIDPEELKFGLIKDPLKRADLKAKQEKEKAEGDQRLYAQMIDVLHKQIKVAFNDVENTKEYQDLKKKIDGVTNIVKVYSEQKKTVMTKLQVAEAANDTKTAAQLKRQADGIQVYIDTQNRLVEKTKKDIKKLEGTKKSVLGYLEKRGIHTKDQAENKIMEYTKLMDEARDRGQKADELKEQYYKEALEENEKNKYLIPTMEESISSNVKEITTDLHPMDEEYKAILTAENEAENAKKGIKKSLFVIENGRLYVRRFVKKSDVETVII